MRPATQQYRAEDRPPFGLTLFSALQHLAVIAPIGLVFPVLVATRAGASQAAVNGMMAASMLVLGLATLLQCMRWRGLGSGFFAPAIFTAAYLGPSLAAAEQGGLPLVFGMTIFAGLCEMAMSQVLTRLRPYLPTEIAGLAVTMIGVILGLLAFRLLVGLPTSGVGNAALAETPATAIGVFALAAIIVVNIWGPRPLRIYAVLIALVVAWIAAACLGVIDLPRLRAGFGEGLVWWPPLSLTMPTFEPGLAFEFAVSALASSLRAVGDLTTCQKINNPGWLRPDMASLKRGVLADGLGTVLAGVFGTVGLNTFSGSIGLSAATGVMARRVGFVIGFIFIGLAFVPGAIAFAESIPLPVTGAILLFASTFVVVNGLQVILSRLLDNRKILVFGLGLIFGLSRDVFPSFFGSLPTTVTPLIGSSLVEALLVAILLNLVFRIGVASRARMAVVPGLALVDQVHAFCQAQGGAWAARRDVMQRVTTALVEFAEASETLVDPAHEATIELTFDEYHIDATIRYVGRAMVRPDGESSRDATDILQADELPAHLPLLIIRRMADKSDMGSEGTTQWLRLGFDH